MKQKNSLLSFHLLEAYAVGSNEKSFQSMLSWADTVLGILKQSEEKAELHWGHSLICTIGGAALFFFDMMGLKNTSGQVDTLW